MKRRQVKRSYQYAALNVSKEPRAVSKVKKTIHKRNWWRGVWHFGPYIIAVVLLIYLVMFSNVFQINNIDVQGPNTALSQDLRKGTEQYLNSRLFGRNWLIINTQDLRSNLQKSFNGQESITVDKAFPSKLIIKTDEQKPGLVWKTGSRRYIVSINGRVMSELQQDPEVELQVVVDTSNIPVAVGDTVASRRFVAFLAAINTVLNDNRLGPAEFSVRETTGELNARISQGYDIKFDTTTDATAQARSLQAILDHLRSTNKKPNEYIDLRIAGKAFFR